MIPLAVRIVMFEVTGSFVNIVITILSTTFMSVQSPKFDFVEPKVSL